jgi:predicted pyridoxine 5'-phosphate oxidase superfamily flavin-nucleotide-binding protein
MPFTSDVAFTEAVKRVQGERGSRRSYAKMEDQRGGFASEITSEIAAYIAKRDSAYLATASASGQPYVQHRGGPAGFLKVLDSKTLAFADFVGNRQYITTGNLAENDRAFLFLINYAERERVKIWGRAHIVTDDLSLFGQLADPNYEARIEQAIVFRVVAWDINCPQHIPRLVHAEGQEQTIEGLQRRVRYLEETLRGAAVAFTSQ